MGALKIDDQGRPEPPREGDEVATLLGFLDFQRATFEWRTRGLSDEQLRVALPPSAMTLGGMLKHLAMVEDFWCSETVAGNACAEPWADIDFDAEPDWEWRSAGEQGGGELRALWSEYVGRSRAIVAARLGQGVSALDEGHDAFGERFSLRWILVHLVEEYARHNGHADLIRESIDGETGE